MNFKDSEYSHSLDNVVLIKILAQVALGDLVVGMQVWVQNLLPLACSKASTPGSRDIALQFAERYACENRNSIVFFILYD